MQDQITCAPCSGLDDRPVATKEFFCPIYASPARARSVARTTIETDSRVFTYFASAATSSTVKMSSCRGGTARNTA